MPWPAMTDFQDAIQNPRFCFVDPELRCGTPVLDNLGLPRPVTGGFASVYQIECGERKYAVRCFLKYRPEQETRYATISNYLQKINLPYMVDFEFLKKGIKVKNHWYPVLKMEWVNGEPLNSYLAKNINNPHAIRQLTGRFWDLSCCLRGHSVSHGDLQHGNLLVVNGNFRLVDYDGMYVPGMENMFSLELGHPNYQHPGRTEKDFGPYLDHFSTWVIYTSLKALCVNQNLWQRFGAGDSEEFLLFHQEDFRKPDVSAVFDVLQHSTNNEISALAALIRSLAIRSDVRQIPPLDGVQMFHAPDRKTSQTVLPGWLAADLEPAVTGHRDQENAAIDDPRNTIKQIENDMKRLKNGRDRLLRDTERKIGKINKRMLNLDKKAGAAAKQVDQKLDTDLQDIFTRYQAIKQEEVREVAEALNEANAQLLTGLLTQFEITQADIPGMGPHAKRLLYDAGIKTAADIANIKICNIGWGSHAREVVIIENGNGSGSGSITFGNLGAIKANRLLNWRQGVESKIKADCPLTLVREEEIKLKYRTVLDSLQVDAEEARQKAAMEKREIGEQHLAQRQELIKQLEQIQSYRQSHLEYIEKELKAKEQIWHYLKRKMFFQQLS